MLSSKLSSVLEAEETKRIWAFHGTRKVQQGTVEGFALEKGLKNNHMRCNACVPNKENPVRNKALSPILVLRHRDRFMSNVMQFLQDIANVVA